MPVYIPNSRRDCGPPPTNYSATEVRLHDIYRCAAGQCRLFSVFFTFSARYRLRMLQSAIFNGIQGAFPPK
jgi:hypothetical protein